MDETPIRDLARRAPEPAGWRNVRTGTAGWTDPSLVQSGRFYPPGSCKAGDRLGYYGRHFDIVEVDATYYSILPATHAARWAEVTAPDFRFHIKAHPVFTGHPIDLDRLPHDLVAELERGFFASVEPLAVAGKLACVALQFPPWFEATRGNARRIELLRERFPDLPMSVELRHPSWLVADRQGRVLDLLSSHRFVHVGVDAPGLPAVMAATHPDLAVVRLHGRNLAAWQKRGASVAERFDYLYGPDELAVFIDPVRRLAREVKQVHVIFNNCVRDFAVVDAKGLAVLLSEQ